MSQLPAIGGVPLLPDEIVSYKPGRGPFYRELLRDLPTAPRGAKR